MAYIVELPRRGEFHAGPGGGAFGRRQARADNQSTCTDGVRDEGAYGYRQDAVSPGRIYFVLSFFFYAE
jgi:hypothetical protein